MANTPSITAQKGRSFLCKVSDGSSPTTYVTATGCKTNDFSVNGNPVDMSNKGSAGWRELLPDAGLASVSVSGSGIWDSANAQLKAIQAAAFNRTAIEMKLVSGALDSVSGTWLVPSFKRSGQDSGAETFDFTFESTGPVTYSTTSN